MEKDELFIPIVEKDKGPVVRWFANRALDLASWLVRIASPYGNMYTLTFEEPEEELEGNEIDKLIKWMNDPNRDTGAF
jgi:hypothetical protein